MVPVLIDWFYAVSALFQPYNGGLTVLEITCMIDSDTSFTYALFSSFRGNYIFNI